MVQDVLRIQAFNSCCTQLIFLSLGQRKGKKTKKHLKPRDANTNVTGTISFSVRRTKRSRQQQQNADYVVCYKFRYEDVF